MTMTILLRISASVAVGLALGACGSASSASAPASSNAAAFVATPEQLHTLQSLNAFRAKVGAPSLTLDGQLSIFAGEGSRELAANGQPHAHFISAGSSLFKQGFCSQAAENQAPGWTGKDSNTIVDSALQAMMDEGPGGGHHDNILNPKLARVGVGIVMNNGAMFLTNDFSAPCN